MWLVVCFTIDNTVFVIPDTWYNNGMSAWPKSYIINKKRMIEKKIPPNDRDFDYYRCRILAKNIETFTEAYNKCKQAEKTSDLSSAEDVSKKRKLRNRIISINNPKQKFIKSIPDNSESDIDLDNSDIDKNYEPPLYNPDINQLSQICIENNMSDEDQCLVISPNKQSTFLLHNNPSSQKLNSSIALQCYDKPNQKFSSDFKTSQRKLFSPHALANSTLPSSNKKTLQQTKESMKSITFNNSQICIENSMSDQDKGLITPPNKHSTLLIHNMSKKSQNLNSPTILQYNDIHDRTISSGFKTSQRKLFSSNVTSNHTSTSSNKKSLQQSKGRNSMKSITYNSQICIENSISNQDKGLVTPNKHSTLQLHSNETFSENLNSAMQYNNDNEHEVSSGFKTSHNTILISSDVVASTPTSSKKKSLQQTKDDEFKCAINRQLIAMKYEMRSINETMQLILHKLEENSTVGHQKYDDLCLNYEEYDSLLPIQNENDLNTIENLLIVDNTYRKYLIKQLSLIGGKTVKKMVMRIMIKLFTDTFLAEYSFNGRGNKKKMFQCLSTCKIIFDSVRKLKKFDSLDGITNDIEQTIKYTLIHAPFRIKKINSIQ